MSLLHTLISNAYSIKATDIGLNSGATDIGKVFNIVVKILSILIGSLSVIFIIVGGLQMVSSSGDPQRFRMGRESVIYACVGLVIAIGAYAIVSFVANGVK